MRFTQNKIHALAEKIIDTLAEDAEAKFLAPRAELELAVAGAIAGDLHEEEEIEEEVDTVVQQYRLQIENEGMDEAVLRRKIKNEIARKRGFKL